MFSKSYSSLEFQKRGQKEKWTVYYYQHPQIWKPNDFKLIKRQFCFSHGLQTPREKIAFTARPKIHSHSQIFRYGQSIFCLPHRPNFSDIFDLCLHWVSVVRGLVSLWENDPEICIFPWNCAHCLIQRTVQIIIKFFRCFLENIRHQIFILKLPDL